MTQAATPDFEAPAAASSAPSAPETRPAFSAADARRIIALAEAATPAGEHVRPPDAELVGVVASSIERMGALRDHYGKMLLALDLASIPLAGGRLSELPIDARTRALERLADSVLTTHLVRGATAPIKLAQILRGPLPDHLGGNVGAGLHVVSEPHKWDRQIVDARTLPDGETFEVDCVVVGSGAGGAPVAATLAAQGHAVLVLEAGPNYGREDFQGRSWERAMTMMRQHIALGPAPILVPVGETVGGTTTVNSGTCLRPPLEVMRRWRFEDELTELDPASLEPFFARVEAQLGVEAAQDQALGNIGRIVARGAEKLGWSHGPLTRNAPGCDGQGTCCFGCPTDAKRSTNVSYLPAALRAGATLIHHARVEEILLAGGRAVGVVARILDEKRARRVRVHAKAVVLSCGSIGTPALLMRLGLCGRSGELGKNLTVHPASHAWGLFDERVEGWRGIPQGYGVDSFIDEGIRFEGAFLPLDIAGPSVPYVGPAWTRFVERYDHQLSYGYMIADTSRGRVLLGPGKKPQLLYRVNETDRRRIVRGQALLARLLLAAGAREVLPAIRGVPALHDERDIERLEREDGGKIASNRLDLSAYHPLGTCKMGKDPARSVVGPTNETHDVPGLFVVDGSTVNGPLGVNPQVTIMALAERATTFIAERIEGADTAPARPQVPREAPAQLEFRETMRGSVTRMGDRKELATHFTVRAHTVDKAAFARALPTPDGAALTLTGTTVVTGLADGVPCEGTLRMRPLRTRGTLIYDLDFTGNDGARYHLHGEKSVSLASIFTGMTTLHTELTEASDGVPFARGILLFAFSDLRSFLSTWRFRGGQKSLGPGLL